MRNTIRMNSAAMRENTIPTTTLAIEDNSKMKPPNGLIAIAANPEKIPEAEQHDQCDDQPVKGLDDGRGDEPVPLEKIVIVKHFNVPRLASGCGLTTTQQNEIVLLFRLRRA